MDLWEGRSKLQCITERVFITNFFGAKNWKLLQQAAVTHVLVCAAELPFVFEKNGLIYKRLDLADNTTSKLPIAEAVSFVEDALTTDTSVVLIHCAAGSSRSGAIAVALLMRRENLAFHEALQRAQQIRPVILPNPGFVEQLQEWGKGQMK
jgi:protein-tyrosine phosphatase